MSRHVVAVVLAYSLVSAGAADGFRVTGDVRLRAEQVVDALPFSDNTVLIATRPASTGAPGLVRLISASGRELWSRTFRGLAAVQSAGGRALVISIVPRSRYDLTPPEDLEIIALKDGKSLARFHTPDGSDSRLSTKGDAVVWYDDPIVHDGPQWTIHDVTSARERTMTATSILAGVQPFNFDFTYVLRKTGDVDAGTEKPPVWTATVPSDAGAEPGGIDLSADGQMVLIRVTVGGFSVLACATGAELFHYRPHGVGPALESLGILADATTAVATRPAANTSNVSLDRLAITLEPSWTATGHLTIVDDVVGVLPFALDLDPRTGHVDRLTFPQRVYEALDRAGYSRARDRAQRIAGRPRIQRDATGSLAVVVIDAHVVILRRDG